RKRFEYMKEAIEEDETCVPCYWQLARRSYGLARQNGNSYSKAISYYKEIENLCPSYHSDVYYYLGLMYFQEDDAKNAEVYFKKFIEFRNQDEKKFSKNYTDKLRAAKAALPDLNFKNTFFNNPVPFDPVLVRNVSTEGEEYLPMISADDETLFFTRVYNKKGLGDIVTTRVEELVIGKRNSPTDLFDKGTALPKPFNQGQNYGGVSISINNKELYLCACEKVNNYNNCDIFVSNYEYVQDEKTKKYIYKWSELKNLGENINSNTTWEAQPSISADGKTLYFATSRPTSKGIDIYSSERDENGVWSKAKSLGNVINSEGNDKAPFLHTDSKTLYFASQVSDSRKGAGDYDIFYSKQDKSGVWSKPKNLGYPINSEKAEDGLIVNITGETAYFSSGKQKQGVGGKDIFSFELPEEAKPEKVVLLKGKMKDGAGNAVTQSKLKISYKDKSKDKEINISSDDGNFAVAVNMEDEEKVLVSLKQKGAAFQSRIVKEEDAKGGVLKDKDMTVEKIEKGAGFIINDVKFATNSSQLDENAKFILMGFSQYLLDNKSIKFKIVGHTDNVGDANANKILSADRANSVKEFLIGKGIESSRITSEGKGEAEPKVKNDSEQNKQTNRRTEFKVLDF
ncbi:MAG: OmpA family protein, partial [Flavobacteriales bacterium]